MAEVGLRLDSLRAHKARLGVRLAKVPLKALAVGTGAVLGAGGVVLLGSGAALGWLLLGAAAVPFIGYRWAMHDLIDIPVEKGDSIDAVLEPGLLGLLKDEITPRQVAEAVMRCAGGQFFAVRFGIGPAFLAHLASDDPADMPAVWREARHIQTLSGEDTLSAAAVTAALIKTIPQIDTYLAQLQLSSEDVTEGALWNAHIFEVIRRFRQPRRTGGIARDWSFGYTPLLSRLGRNISDEVAAHGLLATALEGHQDALQRMVSALSGGGRRNVALVGPLGVGKSTIVEAFAETILLADNKIPSPLRFRQVVALDAATLIAAAPGRGELEGLVNQLLIEAYRAKNVILCLDDAQLFFEDGIGSVDISTILQPVLDGGALPLVLTMDEQRWLQISQRNPSLVTTLNRINVGEPGEDETMRVLQDQLLLLESRAKVSYMYQALREAYRLSKRYVHEQAMPGKAIKLLSAAAEYADQGLVTAASVQTAVEKTLDVKVGIASGADERQTLLNLEDLIHRRMINQTRAVQVVSDALRRARSGVRNPDRPVGTFLFLGPTGVGKTELSKALAGVYFGGEERLVRLDLNEFVRADDVARLIADGAADPHSLTAQVSKQPFSVVLLDEIEKAHPNVLNTLLQVLDEGILRDINNREVSFRDAIIIATSNAGADAIREMIQAGHALEEFEEPLISRLIDSGQFKPEFLNRFDEIVLFRPLTQDELVRVVDLMIAGINRNLSLQKIQLEVADDAKRYLVEKGYDPRLGARPMRRVVQRTVENLIAKRMLGGEVAPGSVIRVTLQDVQQ